MYVFKGQEMQLEELDQHPDFDMWITDQAALLKDGSVAYTQYWNIKGSGSLILRKSLEPEHEESPQGLLRKARKITKPEKLL